MIRIGIIGTGGMANAHAKSFGSIPGVRLVACCDVVQSRAEEFAKKHEIPAVYTDYRRMLAREKLDGVTNVTPDAMHCPVALAVMRRGLAILSEKPLATSLAEAKRMAAAAKKARVINLVNFSYRNSCGLQAAATYIRSGKLGEIRHVESSYLQSWLVATNWGNWRKSPGLAWRLSTRHGSLGDLGDIGCHVYDATSLLCGDIAEIRCDLRTFPKVRGNRLGEYVLDANDSFAATLGFAGGALGVIHSSRWATGQMNSLRFRVYGMRGGIEVDLDRSYEHYRLCAGDDINKGIWQDVKCKATPNMYQRFVNSIRTGKNDPSDFANGAKVQAYLHASFESARTGRPARVKL
jgi:predicted dehydrogenase